MTQSFDESRNPDGHSLALLAVSSTTNIGSGFSVSTDLASWTNIGWGFTDTSSSLVLQDTNAPSFPTRFYRTYWPLP